MSYRRPRPTRELEDWEQLEQAMKKPARAPEDTELIDDAPREVMELRKRGTGYLHTLADALRIAPKPDGLMPQAEHAKAWSKRARFLSETDHEKARQILETLRRRDWEKRQR